MHAILFSPESATLPSPSLTDDAAPAAPLVFLPSSSDLLFNRFQIIRLKGSKKFIVELKFDLEPDHKQLKRYISSHAFKESMSKIRKKHTNTHTKPD